MVIAEKPLSANRGRPSPRYTGLIQSAARAQGAQLLTGHLYVRIVWFQRERAQGDVDNMAKLILDSLKGIVFQDDDNIVRCLTQKAVADGGGEYVYDPSMILDESVRSELRILLGAAPHVLYIEVGAVIDPMVSFGPVA
jgi:hypothetical protein